VQDGRRGAGGEGRRVGMSSSLFLFRMSDGFGSLRSLTRILNIVGFMIGFMHCRFDPGTTPGVFLTSVIDSVRIAQAEVQDESC
jgi:hypothetical protein